MVTERSSLAQAKTLMTVRNRLPAASASFSYLLSGACDDVQWTSHGLLNRSGWSPIIDSPARANTITCDMSDSTRIAAEAWRRRTFAVIQPPRRPASRR